MYVYKSFCKTFHGFMTTTQQSLKRFIKTAQLLTTVQASGSVNSARMKKIVK